MLLLCQIRVKKMFEDVQSLYNLCVSVAVADCVTVCKFCKKEFRVLPDNVLFDFYYKMYLEKRLCLLGVEFSDFEVLNRMLKVKHKRTKLLKSFQSLIDHDPNVTEELVSNFAKSCRELDVNNNIIDIGLRLGGFLSEGGWYSHSIEVLNFTEEICKRKEQNTYILRKLLDCYHKRIYAEAVYCLFKEANNTYDLAQATIKELEMLKAVPNLAGLYANFSTLFFIRSEYDKAYNWIKEALKLLNDNLPIRVIIEVLRQAAKSCVIKRHFNQAGLLIQQAASLAAQLYAIDHHPHYSDTLMDYAFYLLNFDNIELSVKVYEKALAIRKSVFEKNNIHVAVGLEDLAYALYVNEYSSGRFYSARECAERSIRIMERILPKDHLMLASAKRVKALILEEIALDMRDGNSNDAQKELLLESEKLHKSALSLSSKAFGECNVHTAKHFGNLGRLYQSMTLYNEAEKMHLRAIAMKEALLGPDDYEVGLSIGHLASLYNYHMKRYKDAEKLYLRSIEISLNLFGESYSGLEYDYRGLINVYAELKDVINMLHYNQRMREWRRLRDAQKPVMEYPDNPQPLKQIVDKFFCLC